MTKGSDLFVAALENEGVERIFGVPGEENLDTLESLRTSSIELVVTRHEQSAAFMAATYGRRPRSTWCVHKHARTWGAEPGHGGRIRPPRCDADDSDHRSEGDQEQPTGQIPDCRHGRDHEAADQVLATNYQHGKHSIAGPRGVPGGRRRAPWPQVHLELPEDVAGETASDQAMVPPHAVELPVAHGAALDRAAEMIRSAKRPLVMLGAAASRPRLEDDLARFLAHLQIPFFTTQMGKGFSSQVTEGDVSADSAAQPIDLWMGTAAFRSAITCTLQSIRPT